MNTWMEPIVKLLYKSEMRYFSLSIEVRVTREIEMKKGIRNTAVLLPSGCTIVCHGYYRTGFAVIPSDGFRPVTKVKEALAAGRAYKQISSEAVRQYAGDHIFVLLPEESVARQATEKLMQSSSWRALSAVKKGQVYGVEELTWNLGDAMTNNRLLTLLPELLRRSSS
ncbi:ABC transporter substrate-binding protein [Paenibacillus sp. 11B]|uniref:ABC transporter substrate-binding protein n=1 Tax=unclassified Paenibacillus TaxID=185978 RepID=UPI00264FE309|nr:ABC transporter substrate-binding protein [Paenibacillus sp. 11B]MDN8587710.1 ABC transporter substrate-binding protein [Paenibacillus sp. 11B]